MAGKVLKMKANTQIAHLQLLTDYYFVMVFVNVSHFAQSNTQTQNC